VNAMRCWYRGCVEQGDRRPLFANAHGLPASIRLCDRHLSELAREPDRTAIAIERTRT
jgi:hypothetical protein